MIILSESARSYQTWGNLRAVQGIASDAGDFELVVYRPFCGDIVPCNLGIIACTPPNVFCFRNRTCIEKTSPRIVSDPGECRYMMDIFPEYKIARRIKITVTRGNFFYRLMKVRDFQIGDLIAVKPLDAKLLVQEKDYEDDELDFTIDHIGSGQDPPKFMRYEEMKPLKGKKLLVRMIAYENTQFYIPHIFKDAGYYTPKMIVTSPWIEGNHTYEVKIAVQMIIDKIRLQVVPANSAVNQKTEIAIKLNGGSDVALTWDFGDGSSDAEKIDVVRVGQKIFKNHLYSQPGVYKIFVTAQNIRNYYNSTHWIHVQYPITSEWKFKSNSPQLLPGKYNDYCFSL